MWASSTAHRLPFRLLCGTLLVMTLLDVPAAAWPGIGQLLGALFLLGVFGGIGLLVRRGRRSDEHLDRAVHAEQKGNLVAAHLR
jgi:hypothetical protein